MPTTGNVILLEVYKKVDQKWTPEQCVRQTNQALAMMGSLGSFPWDQVTALGQVPVITGTTGVVPLPFLDYGKKVAVFNSASLSPVSRVSQGEGPASAAGYISVAAGNWNTFWVGQTGITLFGGGGNVDVYYHLTPPVLDNTTGTGVRWTLTYLDDLLTDLASVIIMDLLKMPVSPDFRSAVSARLAMLDGTYSTERENTGPKGEVTDAIQERVQIGRS